MNFKSITQFSQILTILILGAMLPIPVASAASAVDQGQVGAAVARLLEQGHYTRQKLDTNLSQKIFDNYLRMLDYNRMYLLETDVKEFSDKYRNTIHEYILRGDVTPANEIFDRYRERVEARVAKNLEIIKEPVDFTSNRTLEINREKAPWPKNEAEADRLWRNRIEGEQLQENLSETRIDAPEVVLTRRYKQVLRNIREQENPDVLKTFFSALAQAYDPHTD